MSLNALISLSRNRDSGYDRVAADRLEQQARRRLDEYDRESEQRIAAKAVSREQLAKTCSL